MLGESLITIRDQREQICALVESLFVIIITKDDVEHELTVMWRDMAHGEKAIASLISSRQVFIKPQ